METPFLLFPEEVMRSTVKIWGEIMEKLKNDSTGILNIINAYPALAQTHKRKLPVWLADLVLPHVIPKLGKSDLLNCRRVCKQWTPVLDNFMEDHPTFRPCHHRHQEHPVPAATPQAELEDTLVPKIKLKMHFIDHLLEKMGTLVIVGEREFIQIPHMGSMEG